MQRPKTGNLLNKKYYETNIASSIERPQTIAGGTNFETVIVSDEGKQTTLMQGQSSENQGNISLFYTNIEDQVENQQKVPSNVGLQKKFQGRKDLGSTEVM